MVVLWVGSITEEIGVKGWEAVKESREGKRTFLVACEQGWK